MLIKQPEKIPASEITPEPVYRARRHFISGMFSAGVLGASGMMSSLVSAEPAHLAKAKDQGPEWLRQRVAAARADRQELADTLTPYEHVTQYNNFYEFGYNNDDPSSKSKNFHPHPWQVEIAGHAAKTGRFNLEDLLKGIDLEE